MAVTLGVLDYAIFSASLVTSFCIGIFYAYRDRGNTSSDEYFVADRKVNVFAATASALMTSVSATALIAFPNDAYFRGPGIWYCAVIANLFENIFLCVVFVPIFFGLRLTNVYDYLGMRFNSLVQGYATLVQLVFTVFAMAMNIYAPSLAISAIGGISTNLSIALIGGACVLYTSVGGARAVIWSDVFQTLVILVGTVVLCITGLPTVGGIQKVIDVTRSAERDIAIEVTFNLQTPYTLWSAVFSFPFLALTQSAVAQYYAQRFLVVETLREARFTAVASQLVSTLFILVYVFVGLMMYTFFAGCDPYSRGEIQRKDQLFPLFLVEVFQQYSGGVGLIMAALISTSLSTTSSGVNALAAMTHTELSAFLLRDPTPRQRIILTKIVAFCMGCVVIAITFLGTLITGIVDTVITWSGILLTPVLAVFLLGMFSRSATSTGALVGVICSTLIGTWLRTGNTVFTEDGATLPPLYTNECTDVTVATTLPAAINFSDGQLRTFEFPRSEDLSVINDVGGFVASIPLWLYQLSSVYYHTISCLVTWVVALTFSCFTPGNGQVADQLVVWSRGSERRNHGNETGEEMRTLLDDSMEK